MISEMEELIIPPDEYHVKIPRKDMPDLHETVFTTTDKNIAKIVALDFKKRNPKHQVWLVTDAPRILLMFKEREEITL